MPKGVPTVVWTSLIGHAFLDAYDHFQEGQLPARLPISACEHIVRDLDTYPEGDAALHQLYSRRRTNRFTTPILSAPVCWRGPIRYTRNEAYRALAEKAMQYTAQHQRADSSWYYGEAAQSALGRQFSYRLCPGLFQVLRSRARATIGSKDNDKRDTNTGRVHSFLPDGTPRYYNHKTLPLDIQCCSQAIDTLVFFSDRDPESLQLALKVAQWTIEHMQDRTGYFYYRRYSRWLVNKTPTLHWGQATMLSALAGLYKLL